MLDSSSSNSRRGMRFSVLVLSMVASAGTPTALAQGEATELAEPERATGGADPGEAPELSVVGEVGEELGDAPTLDAEQEDGPELAALEAELSAELGDEGDADEPPVDSATTTGAASGSALGRVLALPNISAVFTAGLFYFSDAPTERFDAHEPIHSEDGFKFQLQELELAIQTAIDPYFRADLYLAFELDGVEVEEAVFTSLGLPGGLQLRVGYFFQRFGRFGQQHFLETSPFVDLPLVNRRFFGGEQLRAMGGELSWLLPLPWFAQLSASFVTANNEVSLGVEIDDTSGIEDFLTVFRLEQFFALSDTWSLSFGLSGAQAPNASGDPVDTQDHRTALYGGDLYLKWRDLSSLRYVGLTVEYIARSSQVPGGRITEGGLYAQLDVRFHRNWQVAVRGDFFGLPAERSGTPVVNGELEPFYAPTEQWRVGGALSFYASEFHRWRLQYNADRVMTLDPLAAATRDPVHEVFLQYQFVLGSHGAHPF